MAAKAKKAKGISIDYPLEIGGIRKPLGGGR